MCTRATSSSKKIMLCDDGDADGMSWYLQQCVNEARQEGARAAHIPPPPPRRMLCAVQGSMFTKKGKGDVCRQLLFYTNFE